MAEKKILHINDLHTREVDFKTVRNYVDVLEEKLKLLIKLKKDLNLYGIIINGDLADGGYQDKLMHDSHMNYIRELGKDLEVYALVIGNHFFLSRDNNIELFLIQPHPVHKTKRRHYATTPVLQTPDEIIIDSVQFSLVHFSEARVNYFRTRKPGVTYHIGLFHDHRVLPSNIRADMNIPIKVQAEHFKQYYKDIDEAICAHVHKPFGTQYIDVDGRIVPIHIPGSFSIVQNSEVEIHTEVNMPMHIIDGESVRTEFIAFPTMIEKLRFVDSKQKQEKAEEIVMTENVFLADVMVASDAVRYDLNYKNNLLGTLSQKGYKPAALETIKLAMAGELDKIKAIQLFVQAKKQGGLFGGDS
jgi:hypothetical protein